MALLCPVKLTIGIVRNKAGGKYAGQSKQGLQVLYSFQRLHPTQYIDNHNINGYTRLKTVNLMFKPVSNSARVVFINQIVSRSAHFNSSGS